MPRTYPQQLRTASSVPRLACVYPRTYPALSQTPTPHHTTPHPRRSSGPRWRRCPRAFTTAGRIYRAAGSSRPAPRLGGIPNSKTRRRRSVWPHVFRRLHPFDCTHTPLKLALGIPVHTGGATPDSRFRWCRLLRGGVALPDLWLRPPRGELPQPRCVLVCGRPLDK